MDWFAVVSLGVYPTPTQTGAQRAIYAASFGLLGLAATVTSTYFKKKLLLLLGTK